jgi:penicillin-binding protein 2
MNNAAEQKRLERRSTILRIFIVACGFLLILKAMSLQVLDRSFQKIASAFGHAEETDYPARGLLLDRDNKLLVVNIPMYEIVVTYRQFEQVEQFDTTKFCRLLNITTEEFRDNLAKDWRSGRFSKSKPFVFKSKLSPAQLAAFQENLYQFPGFDLQIRNVRGYPHTSAAHLLGYIGEASPLDVDTSVNKIYTPGDFIGVSGLERTYEHYLRGRKGFRMVVKDKLGRTVDQVENLMAEPPESGTDIFTTLDLDLQSYGEQLMANKIGAIVAIEPATGEILSMISSPSYDPNLLTMGTQRGRAYQQLATDSLEPFLNRATMAQYPPGSPFKTLVALIAMQEGTLSPDRGVGCAGGFYSGGTRLTACHNHPYCSSVEMAIQHSCNAYFVQVFLEHLNRYGSGQSPRKALDTFNEYLYRFGLGQQLGIDFPTEASGNVPTSRYYDHIFQDESYWRAIWLRSLGIGQGEYLFTNLQLANVAAAIANRGYWMTPHLVRGFRHPDGSQERGPAAGQRHETGIDKKYYDIVVDGMEKVVQAGTARLAQVPGIAVCGKTGTAETNQGSGEDNSVFFAFAPKDDPKIAIAVYVENATWGGTYAAPIASLMIEQYLTDTISNSRRWLEERMLNANLLPNQP